MNPLRRVGRHRDATKKLLAGSAISLLVGLTVGTAACSPGEDAGSPVVSEAAVGAEGGSGADGGGGASCEGGTCSGEGGTCPSQPELLLVDPKNCGACGHDCLGGPCASGKCQAVVLGGSEGGGDWKLWNKALYWPVIDRNNLGGYRGRIRRIDLVTGAPSAAFGEVNTPSLEPSAEYPPDQSIALLAVDAEGAYVSASMQTTPTIGTTDLVVAPHTGGAARLVASGHVRDLAIGPSYVYFHRGDISGRGPRSVYMAPRAGGAPTLLATIPTRISSLAVNDGFVYATTTSDNSLSDEISRVPLTGGSFTSVAQPGNTPWIIGFTPTELFFGYRPPGASGTHVMRANLGSGQQTSVLVSSELNFTSELIVDASGTLYFIDRDKGLMHLPHGAMQPEVLAQFPALTLRFLVQDERALYFTLEGGSYGNTPKLMKLAK
ncbi:MAG TPA: hypothetical protein VLT33_43925 [Labilithrix sp.]|nr:hypothetical protein [Labilithrix sp.]